MEKNQKCTPPMKKRLSQLTININNINKKSCDQKIYFNIYTEIRTKDRMKSNQKY